MRMKLLGERTGVQVSPLALGTGRLGLGPGGDVNLAQARDAIAAYLDAGGNLVDTSTRYLGGRAEELLGELMRGSRREEIVVSSKFGRTAVARPAAAAAGQHRKALRQEVEGSLRRLGTDYIDVYFAHTDDGVTPMDELMAGLDDLVSAGKILWVGLSSFPAWRAATGATIADVRGWAPLIALQLNYNLLERTSEREHFPLAHARGLGLMAWSPLAGGLLTGSMPIFYDAGADTGKFEIAAEAGPQSPEGMVTKDSQTQQIVDTVVSIAKEAGTHPVTVAIAWVLAHGAFPVIGPRSRDELGANLDALEFELGSEQLARLDKVSARPQGFPYEMLVHDRDELGLDVHDPRLGAVV